MPKITPPAPLALSLEELLAMVQGITQQQANDNLRINTLQHELDATRQALNAANEEITQSTSTQRSTCPVYIWDNDSVNRLE